MEEIGGARPPRVFGREWIKHRDLTQERAADRMHVSKGTLSKLLNEQMEWTAKYLAALAHALDVEIDDLFHHPDRPSPEQLLRDVLRDVSKDKLDEVIRVVRVLTGKAA